MTDKYMKDILRVVVAQVCQTIGYNSTQTAPLELLQDVLDRFLREFTRDLRRHVEHYNRTEANLDDMALTLNSININVSELLDYVNNVEPVPFAVEVPKFPARKNSYLNFLKPGSKEVLTRPVHVHDHLPPMLPPEITQPPEPSLPSTSNGMSDVKPLAEHISGASDDVSAGTSSSAVLDKSTLQSLFKANTNFEDGDRPTREVSSVVMTTGGYISPAVEGKMPEAIVPDIIDKLLGLDAPPPPPPPPPPRPATPVVVSRPASRGSTSTPVPSGDLSVSEDVDKEKSMGGPGQSKDSKKPLSSKMLESNATNRKSDAFSEPPDKKSKLFNPMLPNSSLPMTMPTKMNKKKAAAMMQQNAAGMHSSSQNNYASMLLKKAKKQRPLMPGQPLMEKHVPEKPAKLDPAEKTQRKYVKMLQKMAKQGKIPPELLNTIMTSDKKSKILNPAILASLPPGPEKIQLEKLLKKHVKQRQKQLKQQIMESQKQKKSQALPPPLVPLFTPVAPTSKSALNKPLIIDLEEQQKPHIEAKTLSATSPMKAVFTPNLNLSPGQQQLGETFLNKNLKPPLITETLAVDTSTPTPLQMVDGKELKLSNEPDRSKLNIFKKISKQKTPKLPSPTPLRLPGMGDTPIINLPSGTTITPAPSKTLFPPLTDGTTGNVINLDNVKENPAALNVANQQPTDLSMLNRVFGEKPPGGEADLANKPKKRGRKPGSKNSPKIPGALPASLLKKNKKMKMDPNMFAAQMPIPPEFAAATGNLTFDNVAHLFNPLEWAQNKQLHQQMLIMAAAKEKKEQKKKSKLFKQDLLHSDKNMAVPQNLSMGVPTNEEVQNINKKLMRMDTILKPAPSSVAGGGDLSVDTSLITGKKLPSPSMFPATSTSPLKSPGLAASKRMLQQGMEAMAAAAAAGLGQPFMLPNRPAFPNLPSNMLGMLPFPFTARPGLIPQPGLFPTPGLGAFPGNPKHPLLPGLFPFPTLKPTTPTEHSNPPETEDLSMGKKKSDSMERNYCNVAPLVPEFLKLSNLESMKHPDVHSESDLPKTPKVRNAHASSAQENLMKKIAEAHTPESSTSGGTKSIPTTPGGMSFNAFDQLMKKNDSPLDLVPLNKSNKNLASSQDSGLDFSINKKHSSPISKPPITLNNEPIEVSDDSDEMSQPPPMPAAPKMQPVIVPPQLAPTKPNINMDDMFVANAAVINKANTSLETDLSSKELKKLKKQVKKTSANITNTLINPEKSDGVSKLAGGADLIPLTSTGLAYSSKNIPFNSLTANANTTFNPHKTDYSAPTSNVFDNVTITATIPSNSSSSTHVFDLQKKRKEHKKLKKLKEFKDGKIKKKKDKKDKVKNKEKVEKYILAQEKSPPKEKAEQLEVKAIDSAATSGEKFKEKDIKKLKKEKKKEKQRTNTLDEAKTMNAIAPPPILTAKTSPALAEAADKKEKVITTVTSSLSTIAEKDAEPVVVNTPVASVAVVPKLTLKLGNTQSPTPLDDTHKNTSSTVVTSHLAATTSPIREPQREPSPELARISPLVTRPPKHKTNPGESTSAPNTTTANISAANASTLDVGLGDVSKTSSASNVNMIIPPPSPWLSGGTISASSVLLPHQLLQTTKHDMNPATSSASGPAGDNAKTHTSADRQSPLTLITETSRPSSYIDAEGNRVWICPACGKVDDGSPMIGCDGCDAWYHWVCVGIFVAPKDNEDWFCRVCITRKKGLHGSDKKRKRNKKK